MNPTETKPRPRTRPRSRTSRLYYLFSKSMGEENAAALTDYLEDKIPEALEDKVRFLATKEDVARVEVRLTERIAEVRAEISKVQTTLSDKMTAPRWMIGALLSVMALILTFMFKK